MIKLRNHQLEALDKIHNGCVICGGVGSGKSLTSLSYYYLRQKGDYYFLMGGRYSKMQNPKDLYIITTARKRDTCEWEFEMAPFLLSTSADANGYSNKVVVDSWNNIRKYVGVKDSFFIFDEQRVVGTGVWTKSFLKITKNNEWIMLSATPGDTWSDYAPLFIANGFFKNLSEFRRDHVIYSPYTKYPKIDKYIGTKKLEQYRAKILVDMDFKRPTTAHHKDVYVQWNNDTYKWVYKERKDPWSKEPIQNASGLCYILRKVVNSDDSRQAAMLELAERHPKIIVFYNFTYELDILRGLAWPEGTAVAEWNGQKHEPIPVDSDRWIYLVQYGAGAEGWNCIETDTMVFYSQNYSYKVMVQSSGRIDRMNTPFIDLYYYHLKSRSGIDLGISRALSQKKDFNERRFCSQWV